MLPLEHYAILLTFIKLPLAIKTFALSIFEWPFQTSFTVYRMASFQSFQQKIIWMEFVGHCYRNRECSGSVVECLTRDLEAAGSSLTEVTALWSLSKTHLSEHSTGST